MAHTAGRRAIAVVAMVFGLLGVTGPAHAHTEVQRAEPGPGEVVVAPVSRVDITFLDPVDPGVSITVRDADGEAVAGLTAVDVRDGDRHASVRFDPVAVAGPLVVDVEFVALDGAGQRDTYQFAVVTGGGSSSGPVGLVAALGVVAVVAGSVIVALRRRRRPPGRPVQPYQQ